MELNSQYLRWYVRNLDLFSLLHHSGNRNIFLSQSQEQRQEPRSLRGAATSQRELRGRSRGCRTRSGMHAGAQGSAHGNKEPSRRGHRWDTAPRTCLFHVPPRSICTFQIYKQLSGALRVLNCPSSRTWAHTTPIAARAMLPMHGLP